MLLTHSELYRTASVALHRAGPQGPEVLLVDPAWTPDELGGIAADVREWGGRLGAGFSTHAHFDHVLWHPGFGPAPRWASPGAAALAAAHSEENRHEAEASSPGWSPALLELIGQVAALPAADHLQEWGEVVIHDGHSTGHAALWLAHRGVLIVGDMLSGLEIPLLAETGVGPYVKGLDALRPYVERAKVLICGHGDPTSEPMARWDADRRYLDDLLAGREPSDPRLASNAEAHAANVQAAAS